MKSKNLHVGFRWAPVVVVAAGIFVASSIPASDLPDVGFPGIDKLEHALVYAALAAALARALSPSRKLTRWALAATLAIAYGITDEIHQLFVPGRQFDLADLLADAAGAAIGAAAYMAYLSSRQRRARGPLPGKGPP